MLMVAAFDANVCRATALWTGRGRTELALEQCAFAVLTHLLHPALWQDPQGTYTVDS
jgi:hypothetical protein